MNSSFAKNVAKFCSSRLKKSHMKHRFEVPSNSDIKAGIGEAETQRIEINPERKAIEEANRTHDDLSGDN